jgi:tetratricopeptide (TPR) repeat protein
MGTIRSTLIALTFVFMFSGAVIADEPKAKPHDDIILGVQGGYSIFQGHYKSMFIGSYSLGISALYAKPFLVKYLAGEIEFAYARYPVKEGGGSFMQMWSVNIGQCSYLYLHTSRYDRNEKSIKPGLLVKAGAFFPIKLGVKLRIGVEYTLHYLSDIPLHALNFIGGVYYNFNPSERFPAPVKTMDTASQAAWFLTLGDQALQKGDVQEAKANYARILTIDPNNGEAREKLDDIRSAESDYAKAGKLIEEKQYYEALPLLERAGKYLPSARQDQERVRNILAESGEIALLEQKGIELYEKGDYRGCIAVMRRLLLVDPGNRTGLIYLPRAIKRQEALERLR